MHGNVIGLNKDINSGELYICCERSNYRIIVDDEERDVWKLYLERALEPSNNDDSAFEIALRLCKGDKKSRDIVLTAKAEYIFRKKRYQEAALLFAKTTKSFEEICILFHNHQQQTALRSYLASKLRNLAEKEKANATQLSCLCCWLTEMYLVGLNELSEDVEDKKEQIKKQGNVVLMQINNSRSV
jgi:DNA-binding LytR/AlgR family response regulator